jgi:predicted TIM-barrel fold metal-dependent hydrolase
MLFDTHAHVLSADVDRYPYSTLRGGARAPVSPLVFAVEDLVRAMDAGGVDHACIVQRATIYGYDNRYALDAAAAFPGRFVPIVVLDAQDPAAPRELKALAAAHRLGGLRIVAPGLTEKDTAWLDSDEALGLWRAAADLALPVTVILYRLNNEAGRAALLGVARTFRELPILIDHVGLPHASTPETRWAVSQGIEYVVPPPPGFGIAENLAAFDELGHVHFKVTDINFDRLEDKHFDSAAFVRALADRFGAARLLWGSDVGQSPAPYGEKLERLHASATLLDAAERDRFFGGTARRLYGRALG